MTIPNVEELGRAYDDAAHADTSGAPHAAGLQAAAEMAVKASLGVAIEQDPELQSDLGQYAAQCAHERNEARRERDAAIARAEEAERSEASTRGYLERANRELGEVAEALGCDPKDTPLGLGAVAEAAKRFAEKHRCGTFENPGGGVRQCTKDRGHKGKHAFDMTAPPLTPEQLREAFEDEPKKSRKGAP